MFQAKLNCLIIISSVLLATSVRSDRILFLLPIASKSHKNIVEPLYTALAAKGHEVTVVSPVQPSKPTKNIREIVPVPLNEIFQDMNPFEDRKKTAMQRITGILSMDLTTDACRRTYKNKEFMGLLNEKFDLVLFNGFMNDCFTGFVHKIGAPFIILTTQATPGITAELVGNRLPTSFVPMGLLGLGDEMTFGQRTLNFIVSHLFRALFKNTPTSRRQTDIYREALGQDLPDYRELQRDVSMIFSNSYFPLNRPRPLLPDIVEIGGMHCKPAQPLPKDLDDFLSGAEHGFIYFSMGSVLKTDQMPEETRQIFFNVFSRLKQRVIWKWNSGKMDNLPKNVRVSNWLPQQDILGHPKIKLFMTHGGLLSTQEASYHGVPVIGIPIFADQDSNMKQAALNGYGLPIEIIGLTEEILENALNTILNDPTYTNRAKELSAVIQDQMQTPLERAVFWTEYVIRHRGAKHLRSAARKLNTIQYHSIDVMAFLITVLVAVVAIIIVLLKVAYRKMCSKGNVANQKKKRQ